MVLSCTHQNGTLSKEIRKKKGLICPEVYEAFYDFVVGIQVYSETEFEQDRDHLFVP